MPTDDNYREMPLFKEDGVHLLRLDSDPTLRLRDLIEVLDFELSVAHERQLARNHMMLQGLLFQLIKILS